MRKVYTVIIAGGQGTRFWPASRASMPKQFLTFGSSNRTLLQDTADRISEFTKEEDIIIVTNRAYADLCRKNLPKARLICEPFPRNTAPAIGLGAVAIERLDPEGIMLVMWSDHAIGNSKKFRQYLAQACEYIQDSESLGLISVKPEFPHTGFGYVECDSENQAGVYKVKRFREKPDQALAEEFCKAGNYFWNTGIFVWKVSSIMREFKKNMPELYEGLQKIKPLIGTSAEGPVIEQVFNSVTSQSVDYGIMEKCQDIVTFKAEDIQWSDVGSWDVWAEYNQIDSAGNSYQGDMLAINSKNNIVYSPKKLTAIMGLDNVIVVDTPDALLVCDKKDAQKVKDIVEELKKKDRKELL